MYVMWVGLGEEEGEEGKYSGVFMGEGCEVGNLVNKWIGREAVAQRCRY